MLGVPAAWGSQASARAILLRVGKIARVAKGGLLRTFVQPDPFLNTEAESTRNTKVLKRVT